MMAFHISFEKYQARDHDRHSFITISKFEFPPKNEFRNPFEKWPTDMTTGKRVNWAFRIH